MYVITVYSNKLDLVYCLIKQADISQHLKSMLTINDLERQKLSSRRAECKKCIGWHDHVNLSLNCIPFDICREVFSLIFWALLWAFCSFGALIISLFFNTILLVLFCFPPGTLSSYDQPWNKWYAQGLKCLKEYTAVSLWKV